MALATRALGRDGPDLSTVGLGAWAIGGGGWSFGWGSQDDEQSIAAIRRALDLGVNWIDTAAEYGLGHSEEVVGRAVKDITDAERPFILTKCGLVWDPNDPMKPSKQILKPESVRRECEASLRRLGVDRIDLYQFHVPDETGTPIEDSWNEMTRLADEGKVRWCGVSNFTTELLDRCEVIRHVDSVQPPFSLIERDTATDVLPWCRQHGTGVICYSPLSSGLLTTSFSKVRVERMADDDWRKRDEAFRHPALERNLALRDGLQPVAQRHSTTVEAVAIAWVLAWEGVTGAIVGARSPRQVDGWIAGAGLDLTERDLDDIASEIVRSGAGSGHVH
jgi:aryl-alcohol dehydrogenase-like predicted oxidoreductase